MKLLPLLALLLAPAAAAQDPPDDPRALWLAENAVPVRSIAPLDPDDDFADLAPLVELIGDARVVGLGEQTHGDGATFHAKTRMVRFLHQVMGFDLLVWESGMFDCSRVEAALASGKPMREAWRSGVFPVWAASNEVQPLFDYVDATRTTDAPAELELGFETIDYLLQQDGMVSAGEHAEDDWRAAAEAIAELVAALQDPDGPCAALDARERSFAGRTLQNLGAVAEMGYWSGGGRSRAQGDALLNYALAREPAMADTLVWLARERYPERRLIVWAASSHLTYRSYGWGTESGQIPPDSPNALRSAHRPRRIWWNLS
jgi:erythromycin esterase